MGGEMGSRVRGEDVVGAVGLWVDLGREFDEVMRWEVWRRVRRVRAMDREGWREETLWRAWVERCRDQMDRGDVGLFVWAREELRKVLDRYLARAGEAEAEEKRREREMLDLLARYRGGRLQRRKDNEGLERLGAGATVVG